MRPVFTLSSITCWKRSIAGMDVLGILHALSYFSYSSLNFSLYNAYGRKNAFSIDFEEDENDPTRTVAIKTYLFTYIPSITYNFKF
jgi:hypothetical protein